MAMAPTDHTGAAMATTNPTLSGPNWQLIVAAGFAKCTDPSASVLLALTAWTPA